MNTPTPWTDANEEDGWNPCGWAVDSNLVRELERELIAARQELKAVTEQRDQYKAALQSADNHNHEIATKLEMVTEQRDEAREACSPSFDTTETDAAWSAHCIDPDSASGDPWDLAKKLETELTAVTEKLKETRKHLKDANRGAEINAHALRINADKLATVTEQRDEMARAIIRFNSGTCCLPYLVDLALQSLKEP